MIKKNLNLSMKIVLLLLSSAMLAVLCYAAFRENVTEFYDYIDSIEKPFNEDKFFKRFEQEAQEINLYSKNKEDKKALKKLLKKHDIYTNVYIYDDAEDNFLGGDFGKVLDEPVGITPLYSLQNDFEQYSFNRLISGSVKFKDGEGIVYVSSMHLLKYVKYYFYVALFVSLLIFFFPTFIFIKRKVKYINILKQEVLNMSQGDLSHAMTIMSHDELAILAQEMDTLRITLASNYQNEARIKESHQEMITCLSHDLRTPLAALRGYLDILCLHCYKDEKQMDHYLNSCIEKTEQIKDLSNKTFEYSLVYNDDLIPSLETISSESFIQYIEEHLEYLELEGFKIEKEITISSVQLHLDLSMMKRMMDNICSNIQKYARKEQPIYLQISIEKGNLKIVFENEKKEINHEVESNKIGLKSVKKIIEIHQGRVCQEKCVSNLNITKK
ncbi:sensor histidine kinase [Coprobacillus sp. AM37-9BH]|nr:sensor histidine kinase [Coprobacillus sp. AM37-9BH]